MELRDVARRLFHGRHDQHKMCYSLPVAGELVEILADDKDRLGFEGALDELWKFRTRGNLTFYGLGQAPTEVFEMARRLQEEDPLLTPTDTLTMACFLVDEEAKNLYTTDPRIIDSRAIRTWCEARGKTVRGL